MANNIQLEPHTSPLLRVSGLKRYFDVSKPLLNRLLEGKPRQILKAVVGID
ncbi:MAG: ABC transporter ATP-binding protein, partial [Deltaproteobacteria bacterium]|nr:ABC transporter ATP-binding protein [Deltaproteobacteria bacterium]